MELDDFKGKKRLTNDVTAGVDKSDTVRADNIIDLFRSYQKKNKRKATMMIAVNFALAVIYITNMSFQTGMAALGYFLLGAGLFGGAIYLYLRYKTFAHETYLLPIKDFLGRAERQISYFNVTDYLIVIPLLLIIGTGGGLVFIARLLKYTANDTLLIIIWVLFYISLCAFGFWAGKRNWQKTYGDLFEKITKLKNSYSGNHDTIN